MSTPSQRAAHRSADWRGEIVEPGRPKPLLYEPLTPAERLRALTALSLRAWTATGEALPAPLPRSEWPGEVFELPRRG